MNLHKLIVAANLRKGLQKIRRVMLWDNPLHRHWYELASYERTGQDFEEKNALENQFAWRSHRLLARIRHDSWMREAA